MTQKPNQTPRPATSANLRPTVRFERKGRGGKTVTVIGRLPADENLLRKLCVYLKRSLGSGGAAYIDGSEGSVEIQGDHRERALELIAKFKP